MSDPIIDPVSDAFATVDQLEVLLGRVFDDGIEQSQAALLLELATTAIRAEAGQTISLVEDDEVLLAGTWDYDLDLPERPVVDVTSVALNGVPMLPGNFHWNERQLLRRARVLDELTGTGFLAHAPGARWGYTGNWGGPGSTLRVVYSHGEEIIPADLVAICLNAVARNLLTPAGVRTEALGAYSVGYFNDGGLTIGLTDDERRLIRSRYRR